MHLRIQLSPRRVILVLVFLVTVLAAAAWYFAAQLPADYDFDPFVSDLRAAGAAVELSLDAEQQSDWFSVPPRSVVVNGNLIYVFRFADNAQANRASLAVSRDGSYITRLDGTGGVAIDWILPVEWYHRGQLIVQAGGENTQTRALFERFLGRPFAGPNR